MEKLILLLFVLPVLLTNCGKDSQPEGPTTTTTTYKGTFFKTTIGTTPQETPALVVVTENSATDWSMSLELTNQPAQVFATSKNGTLIEFSNQTYLGAAVQGKGQLTINGSRLEFSVNTSGTTTAAEIGTFRGDKQ